MIFKRTFWFSSKAQLGNHYSYRYKSILGKRDYIYSITGKLHKPHSATDADFFEHRNTMSIMESLSSMFFHHRNKDSIFSI